MRVSKALSNRRNLIFAVAVLCALLCATLAASFYVSRSITDELRNNAYDSLMDASEIIRQNVDSAIEGDIALIDSFGKILNDTGYADLEGRLAQLCEMDKLLHAYHVDSSGVGISETGEYFDVGALPVRETALRGLSSVSTGFVGETGQRHLIIQSPIFDGSDVVGAIYGEVVATRYYSEATFVFFDGDGRASLFNKSDGAFVIKAPQTELTYLKTDNIFEAIRQSGNDSDSYHAFFDKVTSGSKSIIKMQYGDISSYIAVLPCTTNGELYVATIISEDDLQVEANSVSRLIAIMQAILTVGLCGLAVLGTLLIYRMMREDRERLARELEERSREELTAALIKAEDANVAKTHFLSNMSHDIRTPMNAILGMTALAGQSLGDDDTLRDCLSVISSSSHHLLDIINDILDMSKIESGNLTVVSAPFAIPSAVNSLSSIISPLCGAKDQSFSVEYYNIEHEYLISDKTKVNRVLMNLLNNANKFTPPGGTIKLIVEELPYDREDAAVYRFSVADNGVGIPKDKQASVFEAFATVVDPSTSKAEGTGLGLSIAKSIVQAMGGTIELHSVPGEGTTFVVTLTFPIQQLSDVIEDYSELAGTAALVVGEQSVCEKAREYLCDVGVLADAAFTAQQAREALSGETEYCAAIVDWEMPDGGAQDTVGFIRRQLGADVSIIALSDGWREAEAAARAAGAGALLSKPLFRSSLYEKLAAVQDDALLLKNPFQGLVGKRLLIVEDNLINQAVATKLLEGAGAAVDVASNGRQAAELFTDSAEGYYDAILMDIQMPVLNGYEATKLIRKSPHPDAAVIPIIALTANVFAEDNEKAAAVGMNAHLTKPIEPKMMIETLKRLTDERPKADAD